MTSQDDVVIELLSDIEKSLVNVTRDFFPSSHYQLRAFVSRWPSSVTVQVIGKTDAVREAALRGIAEAAASFWTKAVPSLRLKWTVVGGTEAAGIVAEVLPSSEPVTYGSLTKMRFAWVRPSSWLRRQRPWLPERINL